MQRNLILILVFLTFIVNCSNLDNQNDQAQLICGETKDKSFAWLHMENVEDFDAILVKDGSAKTASKTPKSCIAITEEDRDYQLFVRDSATKKLTLSLDLKNLAPGLSNFSLAQNSQNQKLNSQVRCWEPEIFAADKLALFFKRSAVDIFTHPMAEIKIFDHQKNLRLQKTLTLGDTIPSLHLGLSDGRYSLEMRNFDAFTPESLAGASPEVCTLVIDTGLPVTQLKTQSFTTIADINSAFKIPPGAKLEFSTDKDPGVEVYVCLKQRGDEKIQAEACNLEDFNNVGNKLNVIEEVIRGFQSLGSSFDYYYYRTAAGAEVDLVLEGSFGLLPIEIKYGQSIALKELRGIRDFVEERKCKYGVVINNDEKLRLYDDRLIGIPFNML